MFVHSNGAINNYNKGSGQCVCMSLIAMREESDDIIIESDLSFVNFLGKCLGFF